MAFVRDFLQKTTPTAAAFVLDAVCARSQGRNTKAEDVLLAFTGLLNESSLDGWFTELRQTAEREGLSSLLSHIRAPAVPDRADARCPADEDRRVPDDGKGRPLTLGERKSFARRPSRVMLDKLLADPHPSVIQNLLNNSVTTEDDVVRLAAKRPLRTKIMAEIARHPRWNVRRRVRLALVLNPGCPPELGVPLVGLLHRSEMETVAQHPGAHPEIRQAAIGRLRGK